MNPFSSTSVIVFSAFLSLQAVGAFFINRRTEYQPNLAPLASLPSSIAAWRMVGEYPIEKEVQDVLKATDTLSRVYVDGKTPHPVSLFIAYFKSQRSGVAPHSPKNCLPGNGWVSEHHEIVRLAVPGVDGGLEMNQYVVQKGESKSVVSYWYQSHGRVIASEYKAKVYVVIDAIVENRTDTSLVKVSTPVINNDVAAAVDATNRYIADSFASITASLPN